MKINKSEGWISIFVLYLLSTISVYAVGPSAPTNMTNVSSEAPAPTAGYMLNNSGGTITTLNINATTQNPRWKGFVGNVSGQLALLDSSLNALYDWDITTITGEIYATRNSTIPDWSNVECATDFVIASEQTALNIISTNVDSINNTFDTVAHNGFYIGETDMPANSCPAIALNVNNTAQSTDFQEILLQENVSLIYTSLLEDSTYGFDNQTYDFQMIVAENALEGTQPNTVYYFYIELI